MSPQGFGQGSHDTVEENTDAIVSRLAQQDRIPWYKKPNLRLLYLLMFPTCLGVEMTSGFDSSMVNGLQAVPSWLEYFHHPRSALLGLITAAYSLGAIIAIPFVPSVVDDFGRRFSIFIGSTFMIVGGVLQGAALNVAMFILARFILGLGIVFAIVAATSLVGELSHPKERAIMGSLFNSSYMIGALLAAGVTLGTFAMPNNWGWRIPSFLQVLPSLLQVSFIWFLPESPRWLVSKERGVEAYNILVRYHAEGDTNSEFVKAEYAQIKETLEAELKSAQMNWMEVLSTTGTRKRLTIACFLGLFTQWSGNGLLTYFLSPVLDNVGIHDDRTKNIVNLAKGGWSLVNATCLAITMPRFPRRGVYLACTISLLVVFTAWTAASAEYAQTRSVVSSQAVLALIFLYSPAYNIAFNALTYTFLVELFPFHIRARGITIYQWCSRIASFTSQVMDPIGIGAIGWRYYIIYCVWIAFEVVFVYVMFPETSGRTLEELTFLYEGNYTQQILRNTEVEALLQRESRETDG